MSIVHALVEGYMDEAAANRILAVTGHTPGTCYGKKGFGYIRKKITGFNETAHDIAYLAMVDFMDTKLSCPPEVVTNWLPHRRPKMLLRVVVNELESWLLADRSSLATFLHIVATKIPRSPEQLSDPKRELINLARKSRNASIRSALVPESDTTAQEGKLYTSEMTRYISLHWNPQSARINAPSLDKCMRALERFK